MDIDDDADPETLRRVTPVMRFLAEDCEATLSHSSALPMQEGPVEANNVTLEGDDSSMEDGVSMDSWSDPDETLANIWKSPSLAMRLF